MKWSAVLAVCAAPFALGGILDVDIVGRADGKGKDSKDSVIVGGNVVSTATTEIIIIWVNNGNGAPTETINSQVSASATSAAAAAATHQVSFHLKSVVASLVLQSKGYRRWSRRTCLYTRHNTSCCW